MLSALAVRYWDNCGRVATGLRSHLEPWSNLWENETGWSRLGAVWLSFFLGSGLKVFSAFQKASPFLVGINILFFCLLLWQLGRVWTHERESKAASARAAHPAQRWFSEVAHLDMALSPLWAIDGARDVLIGDVPFFLVGAVLCFLGELVVSIPGIPKSERKSAFADLFSHKEARNEL